MATDYDALVLRAETAAGNAAVSAEQAAADRQAVEQLTLTINKEQAVSIQNSKEEIRQAIVAKGQECDTSVAFADYADKILSITTDDGGVDTSNDTVTADSMLLGVTAHNAAGVQITGTIAASTPTIDDNLITIPAGHIASDTTLTVDEAATATVSDNTVTINKGYTSKEYAVSVATAGAVVTDRNVVTVPKGWHDGSTVTLVARSLPNISIAVDPDSGRVTASYTAEEGWHNAGTIDAAETMDVQVATEYTPGTSDIIIPAYKFLTGAQTIKGEPTLVAENIPSDMNFFGIQGTREIGTTGGGSCKFYECANVDDGGSWSGYEWLLTATEGGECVYTKSETLTEGLPWTSVKPKVGKSYTEDALVEVTSLYQSEDNGGTEEPEEPEEPVEPEQPEASFGTYLQISGSTAVNEGLAGVYKLNESTATDINKEWININDDTKKVTGYWEEVDPATYWYVKGGSDNYSYDNWGESSMSYPWNADNSSFVWYYHAEPVSDFHVTPYVSDEEDPSTGGDNGSDGGSSSAGDVLVVSGSYQSDDNGNYSPGAADGEYTLKDPSATGAARVWVNSNGTFELRAETSGGPELSLWGLYNTSGMYDHYTYWIDNGHNEPINSDGSSVDWRLQGIPCSNMTVTQKA